MWCIYVYLPSSLQFVFDIPENAKIYAFICICMNKERVIKLNVEIYMLRLCLVKGIWFWNCCHISHTNLPVLTYYVSPYPYFSPLIPPIRYNLCENLLRLLITSAYESQYSTKLSISNIFIPSNTSSSTHTHKKMIKYTPLPSVFLYLLKNKKNTHKSHDAAAAASEIIKTWLIKILFSHVFLHIYVLSHITTTT